MKKLLLITTIILMAFSAMAQDKPPVPRRAWSRADSAALRQIREKVEQIKKERPVVAVVLSGGGAKGVAHIGVLKYLEDIDMPIDMILGTSMGGLIGGLYAMGYKADQLDSIVYTMDWNAALTDRKLRENISYSEMKYKEKYLIDIPFYYSNEKIPAEDQTEVDFAASQTNDKQKIHENIISNIVGSLPSGFTRGQNVMNIITSLSVGYQDSISFASLPIPYMCVATEMVRGEAAFMASGKLVTAMRSTMSIPGIYAPVKYGGMVLVDGGMRDNYPVGMAKELGADIVIGVELSDEKPGYDQINNLMDIFWQGIDMLGSQAFAYNHALADVNIKPDTRGYNMMSFDKESINALMQRGYEATRVSSVALMQQKQRLGEFKKDSPTARPAIDINKQKIQIDTLYIHGVPQRERNILLRMIQISPGDIIDRQAVEKAVGDIYGTGAYEHVTYELKGEAEPFELAINCKKGPIHRFGAGFRLDTEEIVAVLLNIGLNSHKLYGSTYDFTTKIGVNPYFKVAYTFEHEHMPTINANASVRWVNLDVLGSLGITPSLYRMKYFETTQEAYMSNVKWKRLDLRGGLRNRYFMINSLMSQSHAVGDYDFRKINNDYLSMFFNGGINTFDTSYYPKSGFSVNASYEWVFTCGPNKFSPFHVVSADAKVVIPAKKAFAFIPSANLRFLFGDKIPVAYMNVLGGDIAGRYFDQQFAFIGKNNVVSMGRILTMLRADFRLEPVKNHYISAIVNYARDCDHFKDYLKGAGWYGAGIEYAYNAFFGPVKANVHWSNFTNNAGFYVSIGFNF